MAPPLGVRFWGTRGLVSSPGKETSKYGGNTSCAQILHGDSLIVIDAGFGVTNLGEQLLSAKQKRPVHILFTHMHWDHIQGLPYFHPIYFPDSELHLYSPLDVQRLHENLDILFDGSYSPFQGIDSMPAQITLHKMGNNLQLPDGLVIRSVQVNHGHEHNHHGKTWGYRFETPTQSLAFITDHEALPEEQNLPVVEFCRGVDLLVHDAQYTEPEYNNHIGWGHSTPQMAIANAHACEAGEVLLTHHDPSRTDFQLDVMSRRFQGEALRVAFAKEGHDYWIQNHRTKKDAG